MAKKQGSRDSSLPGGIPGENPNKYVKPSELSLDLIMPTSIRGTKQSPITGGAVGQGGSGLQNKNSNSNNQSNAPVLMNLRTP